MYSIEPFFFSSSSIIVIHYLITLIQRRFFVFSTRWKITEIVSKTSTNHNLTENGENIINIRQTIFLIRCNDKCWRETKYEHITSESVVLFLSRCPSVLTELVRSLAACAHAHVVQWIMWSMIIGNLFKKTLKHCRLNQSNVKAIRYMFQ